MRLRIYALVMALTMFLQSTPIVAEPVDRILMVISSHGADNGKTRPGYEMDELSQAYLIFKANGLEIDLASPKGGQPVADEFNVTKAYNAAFLADAQAASKLAKTLPLSEVKGNNYAAVFIVGGKGPMFDFPDDTNLQSVIATIYEQGGIVSAVCHGPAALVNVRRPNRRLLVEARKLTGFTDEEEAVFGEKWVKQFPFKLETALREKQAIFGEAHIMLPHVEVDDRIITGQNPYSVTLAAEAVVTALGKQPAKRDLWVDERSMALVARASAGEIAFAEAELRNHSDRYDVPLIAIWGYYRSQAAADDKVGLKDGLAIMQLAAPFFSEPQLQKAIDEITAKLRKEGG